jgi:hypothetical protein
MCAMAEAGTSNLDAEGRVADDVPCAHCGYNVRTLPADGVCPECAHPVAWSLRGSGLCYVPSAWLRRVNRGVLILLCALGAGLGGMAAWVFASTYFALTQPPDALGPGTDRIVVTVVAFGWCALWLAVAAVGLFLLTGAEPLARERAMDSRARRITRLGLMSAIALAALAFLMLMLSRATAELAFLPLRPLSAGAWCASLLVSLVVPIAALHYIGRLMQRAARPGLALFARIGAWCLLASIVLMLVAWIALITQIASTAIAASAPSATFTPGAGLYVTAAASGLGGCGLVAVAAAIFVLLILVWRALTRIAREAEQNEQVATRARASAGLRA